MKYILTCILGILSLNCFSQLPIIVNGHKYVVIPPVGGKDTVRINFSKTSQSVATYNSMFGEPASGVVTRNALNNISGVATAINITTIATANWNGYSGANSSNDPCCAITGAPFYGSTANNATVAGSNFYTYGSIQPARYDATRPQFRITGLKPASTYEIKITAIDGNLGFDCKVIFRAVGLTSPSAIQVNGDVTSQSNGATFTIQPTVGGQIELWCNTDGTASPTGDLAMIPALFITEQ